MIAVIAFYRGWIVPGAVHRRTLVKLDAAEDRADKSLDIAQALAQRGRR